MKTPVKVGLALAVAAGLGALVWRAAAPRPEDADVLSGYVEGEALYLAAPTAGTVAELAVVRGQRVAAGAPLFAIDAESQAARRSGAVANVAAARARAEGAQAAAAQQAALLKAAEAQAASAARDAQRYSRLSGTGAVSAQETDRARTAAVDAQARRQEAAEALKRARTEAEAAAAAAQEAASAVTETEVQLGQLSRRSPAAGRIEETFFQTGEWAPANQPVVSLIPDGKVKLRFYVPERSRSAYRVGRAVEFGCDGCGAARRATIAYVSPRPEFTPPLIYSRKARDRMVFLIEARPEGGTGLAPGQPVDVTPLRPEASPQSKP